MEPTGSFMFKASVLEGLKGFSRAPKKHISKNKDRDIPYKTPYNEAQ